MKRAPLAPGAAQTVAPLPGHQENGNAQQRPSQATRRASLDPTRPLTERQWQTIVLRAARQFGWRSYHTLNSWGSVKGFPDLVLVRGNRLIFAELKSNKGKVSPEQHDWLYDLSAARAEAYVWWPADYDTVLDLLKPSAVSRNQEVIRA